MTAYLQVNKPNQVTVISPGSSRTIALGGDLWEKFIDLRESDEAEALRLVMAVYSSTKLLHELLVGFKKLDKAHHLPGNVGESLSIQKLMDYLLSIDVDLDNEALVRMTANRAMAVFSKLAERDVNRLYGVDEFTLQMLLDGWQGTMASAECEQARFRYLPECKEFHRTVLINSHAFVLIINEEGECHVSRATDATGLNYFSGRSHLLDLYLS